MANNCLNWKSEEVEMLAKQVGVESTPAFADKIGTLMDSLGIDNISELSNNSNEIINSINNDFDNFKNDDLAELNSKIGKVQKSPTELCEFTSGICIAYLHSKGINILKHSFKIFPERKVGTLGKFSNHKVAISEMNDKMYIFDMPQDELITVNDNGENVLGKFIPRMIEVTPENMLEEYDINLEMYNNLFFGKTQSWFVPRMEARLDGGKEINQYIHYEGNIHDYLMDGSPTYSDEAFKKRFEDNEDSGPDIYYDRSKLNVTNNTEQQLPTPEQVKEYLKASKPKSIEKGKVVNPQGLAYAECRLPALWKELFDDPFWIGENNDIDFDKVNKHLPDLLKAFGYRIPNEDKYSSLPLKVTGFLPTGSGGAIMLPAEITTISGSDFDVDKMYTIVKHLVKGKKVVNKFTEIKDGVNDIFEENPELAEIGSKEEYSAYIDGIFPNSKVKDIVYHGTKLNKFDIPDVSKGKWGGDNFYSTTEKDYAKSYSGNGGNVLPLLINSKNVKTVHAAYAATALNKNYLETYLGELKSNKIKLSSIDENGLDIKVFNSKIESDEYSRLNSGWDVATKEEIDEKINDISDNINREPYDTILTNIEGGGNIIYAVFKSEQIHILGSKQDIEGFKKFKDRLNAPNYQVEKYLDDTNSTSKERKLSYTNRLPEAKKVRLSYKDRLQTIKDEISQTKIDNNDLKELKLKSKDLAEQWNDIQDEIESLDTPTTITVGMYKVIGVTDLDAYKDGLKKEFEAIKKEHKAVNTQISELQANDIIENSYNKPWKDNPNKSNKATSFALKNKPEDKFELVKDIEDNYYSVHFKTTGKNSLNELEKKQLVSSISDKIPTGGKLSTWGEVTKGGVSGLNRFKDAGFIESGETRIVKDSSGNDLIIPVLIKESKKSSTSKLQSLYNQKAELYTKRQEEINNLISDEEFNKLSIPQQNTKGARDNEKLDTFIGIYSNPHTAMDIMTPGGYESIRKIAEKINKNKSIPKDIFGSETMDALTIQNIQGRDLKGIAANHNSHASKRQWSNLKLNFPIMFDGRTNGADMLNGKVANSVSGKPVNITRNFAEILAASVDNGKDPLLASINYNQHTADVISLMLATGADINTVFAFINQPVILKAIEMISLGEERDLLSSLKTIAKSMGVEAKVDKITVTNFNQDKLFAMIGGDSTSVAQGQVLANMIKYTIASKDFSDLIAASKADTKGIGKFMEEGITLMRNIKKALTLKTISGTEEFLKGESEGEMNQKFNNIFAKYGVQLPLDNIMSKLYPFLNESFSAIKDVIEQDLGYSISADDARLVDQMLVQYYSSKFEWYSKDNKFNIVKNLPGDINFLKATYPEFVKSDEIKPLFDALVSGIDNRLGMDIIEFYNSQTSSDEQRTDIKKSWKALSSPNAELVLTKALLESNLLTNEDALLLEVTDDYKSLNNLSAIMQLSDKFKGTSVEKLVQDYLFDKLANDLIKYSFYTTGLNFTPKSISSLVPIDLYSTISYNGTLMPDMIYGIQNMQNPGVNKSFDESGKEISDVIGGTDASRFLSQFYKHMADNRKFVPRVEFKEGEVDKNTVTSVDENKIIIIPEITKNDKLYAKDKDGYLTATSRYISYKVDGKVSLYENEPSGDNGMLFFRRINTLGAQGLLYEFDNNGGESSIVPGNNIDSSIKTMKVPTKEEVVERVEKCK